MLFHPYFLLPAPPFISTCHALLDILGNWCLLLPSSFLFFLPSILPAFHSSLPPSCLLSFFLACFHFLFYMVSVYSSLSEACAQITVMNHLTRKFSASKVFSSFLASVWICPMRTCSGRWQRKMKITSRAVFICSSHVVTVIYQWLYVHVPW